MTAQRIFEISSSMHINGVKYQRYIKDEPELSRLMNEYAHNLSGLYALVLKTCRG